MLEMKTSRKSAEYENLLIENRIKHLEDERIKCEREIENAKLTLKKREEAKNRFDEEKQQKAEYVFLEVILEAEEGK